MTLTTTTSRVQYPGAGSVGPFAVPFRFTADTDLRVTRRSSAGAETTLSPGTGFTTTGAGNAVGTLTLVTALAAGQTLSIRRAPPITQVTSIRNQGSYFPATIEDEFDRLVMQMQDLKDQIDRRFGIAETYDPALFDLELVPETGKALVWQSATQLGNATLDAGAIALPGNGRTVGSLTAYLANNSVTNIKDYGAGGGGGDDTAAIQAAFDVGSVVRIPLGNFRVTATLLGHNFMTIVGDDRWGSNIDFEGTGDCIRFNNPYNGSAYAEVGAQNFRITCSAGQRGNLGAGISVNGTGAYFNFETLHIRGPFKYGVIFDQAQLSHLWGSIVENGTYTATGTVTAVAGAATFSVSQAGGLINGDVIMIGQTGRYLVSAFDGTTGATLTNVTGGGAPTFGASAFGVLKKDSAGVWFVDGPDRDVGAAVGHTNVIDVNRNQINGPMIGVLDDGGYGHTITKNNITCRLAVRMCAMRGFAVDNNQVEDQSNTGTECFLLDDRSYAGASRIVCQGGTINGNMPVVDFVGTNAIVIRPISSGAGVFHEGIVVNGNWITYTGQIASIDLTKFGRTCEIGPNFDSSTLCPHYSGMHNDADAPRIFAAPASTTDATKEDSIGRVGGDPLRVQSGRIAFPATQNPSSGANVFDDYEEGNWTAALISGGGTITMNDVAMAYTKKGREVTLTGVCSVTSVAAPTGTLRLTGLPFTVGNATKFYAAVDVRPGGLAAAAAHVVARAQGNETQIRLEKFAAGAVSDTLAPDVQAGSEFTINVTYFVD